jgi:hypothetical protein
MPLRSGLRVGGISGMADHKDALHRNSARLLAFTRH